jgi:sulfide:quinone oxidoreductase
MAKVVVIGAGLGGVPTAYELRHKLSSQHHVILISETDQFTFIPGLVHVALNLAPLDQVQIPLAEVLPQHGIEWIQGGVAQLNLPGQRLTLSNGQDLDYDYLVLATGAAFDFAAIPGLGPHGGYTQSICTAQHALQARAAWGQFLENPGALVVGAAPGTGCLGPAYEFILMADQVLRRHGKREQARLTLITPEPYAGHLGVSGLENAQTLTADILQEQGISVVENAAITTIDPNRLTLADGHSFPFDYAMILPSFQGVKLVRATPELANERGFIPVLPTCRHSSHPNLYALGICVQLDQPEKTPVPIGLPKSGQMTEAMGMAVAHNIAVELGDCPGPLVTPTLEALCFAELGSTGIAYVAVPILPNTASGHRRYGYALRGAWVNWVKMLFEFYFLQKIRHGLGVPWFERLGLQLLFGLSLLRSYPLPQETPTISQPMPQ